jgi:hypothetical protein
MVPAILLTAVLVKHKKLKPRFHQTYNQTTTELIDIESDEFHSATAKIIQEAQKLIEQGYDYVTEVDGFKLFRKPK